MKEKIRSKVVYCEQKKRYVEVDYTRSGPWYSPNRKLASCLATTDSGQSCDYSCVRQLDVPSIFLDRQSGRRY